MEYRKYAGTLLLCGSTLLPVYTDGAADGTSASASAHITLRLPPRAVVYRTDADNVGQLCLSHMPTNSYYLSVRDLAGTSDEEQRLPASKGHHCVPVSLSGDGQMVVIVAE